MPVYFILSGYVLNTNKRGKKKFIKQKFFTLLLPAYIYIFITLPFYLRHAWSGLQTIRILLYVDGKVPYNDPCWFFITLFQVMIVACMIKLPQKGVREKSIIGLLSFILGAIFYKLSIDYFGITKLCIAFGYLSMGTLIRDLSVKIRHSYINVPLYITGVLGIVWFFTAILNGKISMYTVDLGNYVLFLMASVSGSLFFVQIIKTLTTKIRHVAYFIRVGNNTVFIVCTHYVLVPIIRRIGDKLLLTGTWKFGLIIALIVPIIVACYLPICEWLSKHFPVVCGKLKI
ncbi:Fucose 4-O-acetylase [Lachnospiraceae bacterium NLAE-zl-G231]|nr:Fucose 4-O-acetylase [Lachnospiraceae bacterium NLAE-zl-G231]